MVNIIGFIMLVSLSVGIALWWAGGDGVANPNDIPTRDRINKARTICICIFLITLVLFGFFESDNMPMPSELDFD